MALFDLNFLKGFISREALKRNIDPDVALRVARSEGLQRGTWQSRIKDRNDPSGYEPSFGPFQLNVHGLGGLFEKTTGKSVRDPSTVLDQIRFSLDQAKRGGWGPWHGWKGSPWAGITQRDGSQYYDVAQTDQAASPARSAPIMEQLFGPGGQATQVSGEDKKKSLGGLLGDMAQPPEIASVPNLLPQGGGGGSGVQSLPEYIARFMAMQQGGQGGAV